MKIRMHEIPPEGRAYTLDRASGELNGMVDEITRDDYLAKLSIFEKGSFYEIKGHFEAKIKDVCSKCGDDLQAPVHFKFQDILIEKMNQPRGSQYSKGFDSSTSKSDTEVSYYQDGIFDLGDYIRELLVLEVPEYPECDGGPCPNWEITKSFINQINEQSEEFVEPTGHPGLEALKKLRLN